MYPRLYPVGGEFDDNEGEEELLGDIVRYKLPRPLNSSSELLDSDGIFLLNDGRYIYMYIGRTVSHEKLLDWFGIQPSERPEVRSSDSTLASEDFGLSVFTRFPHRSIRRSLSLGMSMHSGSITLCKNCDEGGLQFPLSDVSGQTLDTACSRGG